jgi:hypothetical protein
MYYEAVKSAGLGLSRPGIGARKRKRVEITPESNVAYFVPKITLALSTR